MRIRTVPLAAALCLVLSACGGGGGGGGGIGSTPTPPSSPAPNTSLANLHSDQVFSTTGTSATAEFDLSTSEVTSAATEPSNVQVKYDADAQSYTVTTAGRSSTFAPAQKESGAIPGETRYVSADGSERLTLVVTPYSSQTANQYVGMGYWQDNTVTGSVQHSTFDSFVYGFATPTSAVPHSGSANYVTDVFGLVATPGKEPKAFSGPGTFQIDFLSGVFQTTAYVAEYGLLSDSYGFGGSILFQGAGTLTSGNGFSGNVSYTGFDGTVAGTMTGRFFGPDAQELGASFSADNAAGAIVTGSLTGRRDGTVPIATQTLTNVVANVSLPERFAEFSSGTDTSLTPAFRGSIGYNEPYGGKVQLFTNGDVSVRLTNSAGPEVLLTAADRSASQRAHFTSYDKVVPESPLRPESLVHVDLYKPGAANGELALTYTSFGIWTEPYVNGTYSKVRKDFFVYGFETPQWLLSERTGTGRYDGIVYGSTTTSAGVLQDVGGTSRFDVDFGAQTYSGWLNLTAAGAGSTTPLGTWTFADSLVSGQMTMTPLLKDGVPGVTSLEYNSINPRFYGPNGQEIGATFTIQDGYPTLGSTAITGVTVAKKSD